MKKSKYRSPKKIELKSEFFKKINNFIFDIWILFQKQVLWLKTILGFLFVIFIMVSIFGGLFFLSVVLIELNSREYKAKKEKLEIILSDNGKRWFQKIDNSKINIQVDNETCTNFLLNETKIDIAQELDYKSFPSSKYVLKSNFLLKDLKLYSGLEDALYETVKFNSKINYIWFFARGYADKSLNPKQKYLLDKDYPYQVINYYPIQEKDKYLISSEYVSTLILKDNVFTNQDLPYLRSKFVLNEYFKDIFNSLQIPHNLGILEGKVLKEKDSTYRKVDIYILFCSENINFTTKTVGIWGF